MSCKKCNGSGIVNGKYCPVCDGVGQRQPGPPWRLLGFRQLDECDKCHYEKTVGVYEDLEDGSGEWYYCRSCAPSILDIEQ